MCIIIVKDAIQNKYKLWGNGVDPSPQGYPVRCTSIIRAFCGQVTCSGNVQMARALWIFYASKILEFGDTVRVSAALGPWLPLCPLSG